MNLFGNAVLLSQSEASVAITTVPRAHRPPDVSCWMRWMLGVMRCMAGMRRNINASWPLSGPTTRSPFRSHVVRSSLVSYIQSSPGFVFSFWIKKTDWHNPIFFLLFSKHTQKKQVFPYRFVEKLYLTTFSHLLTFFGFVLFFTQFGKAPYSCVCRPLCFI